MYRSDLCKVTNGPFSTFECLDSTYSALASIPNNYTNSMTIPCGPCFVRLLMLLPSSQHSIVKRSGEVARAFPDVRIRVAQPRQSPDRLSPTRTCLTI